eukprot:s2051_g13.t3
MADICESVIPILHIAVLGPPGSGKTSLVNAWVNNHVPSETWQPWQTHWTTASGSPTSYYRSILLPNPLHEGDDFTALIEVTDCVLQDDTGNLPVEPYKKFCKATGASGGMMESYKCLSCFVRHPMHNFEVESAEPPLLAKSRMGFIVLFDATSASSFEAVKTYLSAHPLIAEEAEKLDKSLPIRFVANKIDMHEQAEDIKDPRCLRTELCYELGLESEKLIRQISVTDYTGVRDLFAELLEECIEEMLGKIQISRSCSKKETGGRRQVHNDVSHFVYFTVQANGESYLDHATDNALAVAVSQVLWGISQKRKPAESCWEVVDDGTVVLSQAGRKAIERLRSRPDDLVAKVKEANIQPPLLPSHAGRQGNRENCVTSVQAIVEKCNKEGTKYTDPRFDICADPAKALYVDAHQPGYDCTVASRAGLLMGVNCSCAAEELELKQKDLKENADAVKQDNDEAIREIRFANAQPILNDIGAEASADEDDKRNSDKAVAKEEDDEPKSTTSKESTWNRRDFFLQSSANVLTNALCAVIENPGDFEAFYTVKDLPIQRERRCDALVPCAGEGPPNTSWQVKTVEKKDSSGLHAAQRSFLTALRAEMEIMKVLDHPNLITICEIFENTENIILVMKLCKGLCL